MRKICIIGGHPLSSAWRYEQEPGTELWCANEAGADLGPSRSRVFQMHPRDWREQERVGLNYLATGRLELPEGLAPDCFGRGLEHVADLRACGLPVYAQQLWHDIPTSVHYPFHEVTEAIGIPMPPSGRKRLYATNTFGYMLALALTEHRAGLAIEEIRLAGVELPAGTPRERLWENANVNYYLGLAAGLGIRIVLAPSGSTMLNAPLYAIDGPAWGSPDFWHDPLGQLDLSLDAETDTYIVRLASQIG